MFTPIIGGSFVTKMEQGCTPFCPLRGLSGQVMPKQRYSDTIAQDALAAIV
jgi:hypothetical protein